MELSDQYPISIWAYLYEKCNVASSTLLERLQNRYTIISAYQLDHKIECIMNSTSIKQKYIITF